MNVVSCPFVWRGMPDVRSCLFCVVCLCPHVVEDAMVGDNESGRVLLFDFT